MSETRRGIRESCDRISIGRDSPTCATKQQHSDGARSSKPNHLVPSHGDCLEGQVRHFTQIMVESGFEQ